MRHSGFLNVMEADLHPGDPDHADIGFLVLQLSEPWRLGADVGHVSAGAARALEALGATPHEEGSAALQEALTAIRDIPASQPSTAVADALLRYLEILFRHGHVDAARDLCDAILMLPGRHRPGSRTAHTYLRRAYAHRALGMLEFSEADYREAIRTARRAGDSVIVLRARLGVALLNTRRGNLPAAEVQIRDMLPDVIAADVPDVLARALHELGVLIAERGRIAEGLDVLEQALVIREYT